MKPGVDTCFEDFSVTEQFKGKPATVRLTK